MHFILLSEHLNHWLLSGCEVYFSKHDKECFSKTYIYYNKQTKLGTSSTSLFSLQRLFSSILFTLPVIQVMRRSTVPSPETSQQPVWVLWWWLTKTPTMQASPSPLSLSPSWVKEGPQGPPWTRTSTWRRMRSVKCVCVCVCVCVYSMCLCLLLNLQTLLCFTERCSCCIGHAQVQVQAWAQADGEDPWECRSHCGSRGYALLSHVSFSNEEWGV